MRKYQQNLILEMLNLCKNEHTYLKGLSGIDDVQIFKHFLICKTYTDKMIDFIGMIFDKLSETIIQLYEYIKLIETMEKEKFIEIALLEQKLNQIILSVKKELKPDKIEVVFLPYNASMADSFETLYAVAKADPMCDAYWIPIPYYGINEDGSIGDMYFDGDLYSKNYEVTDWKEYDFEMRHPDIVFFHNPYDKYNHVTRVHPNYYSGSIKKHCDLLVYIEYGIPYWVPSNPALSVKSSDVFLLPFQIHSDLYVTYSQETAECCRLALKLSNWTQNMYSEEEINDKVMSLGSCKFDNIVNRTEADFELPSKWEQLIQGKKIILFNTSISDLLIDSEEFLNNIKSVIETVTSKNDTILWWRPHPLTVSTFKSMRPTFLKEYEEIVEKYVSSNCGIYDDSIDMLRAIVLSHACLTSESSLMFLYLATGKPFTIMSVKKKAVNPSLDTGKTFIEPLGQRLINMRSAKGANIGNWNCCIWWDNFLEDDVLNNIKYENFIDRFLDFVVNRENYLNADEYKELQLQIFRDFVVNSDGTAGSKIYEYCKNKVMGGNL